MEEPGTQRLTNDDFRKLLASGAKSSSSATPAKPTSVIKKSSEKHDARRKKKNFYAQLKKNEDNVLSELSEKYRDRAKERREGGTIDYHNDARNSTSGYRAVAPDVKSGIDAAERRRQLIEESKFLGGDIQHTHLVKGLDYALLQKVRSEITHQELIQETEMEKMVDEKIEEKAAELAIELEKPESDDNEIKTVVGKNIHRLITMQRSRHVERNEFFVPGRMAYLVELEDENAESDIPTTIIRSKAEIQSQNELNTLTTNDIVVNKLAQIFSYLRQGGKKKNKKRDKAVFKVPEEPIEKPSACTSSKSRKDDISIYDDVDEYKGASKKDYGRDYGGSSRDRDRDRDRNRRHRDRDDRDRDNYGQSTKASSSSNRKRGSYFDKPNETDEVEQGTISIPAPPKLSTQLMSKLNSAEPEGYAECYPGLAEMDDAVLDSDDEVDYTKMDKGNKKGLIGRWDFETQEEYSDYMGAKEALPRAAFQYGLKMSEGRKTRKNKNENQKLDQEWQKIQKIITKRKGDGGEESEFKKAKN